MKTIRLAALAPLLLIATGAAEAAPSADRCDGSWSVIAKGNGTSCTGPYNYPIVIRNGQVDDAGDNNVDATGRATPDGGISGTIRQGLATVTVSGRLKGKTGSGQWTLTGITTCNGRWTARRVG